MADPNEQQVEAAARALHRMISYVKWEDSNDETRDAMRADARVILTAAAEATQAETPEPDGTRQWAADAVRNLAETVAFSGAKDQRGEYADAARLLVQYADLHEAVEHVLTAFDAYARPYIAASDGHRLFGALDNLRDAWKEQER